VSVVSAQAPPAELTREREWWLRTLAVFQSPRAVFAALRDDSDEQADARQEPVLALVLLAGLAGVLATPSTGSLLDNPERDGVVVAVILFLSGGLYGLATYWLGGAALFAGARGAGSKGSYRRSRHTLAFAAAPVALSLLVVWPLQLAVYGGDLFRSGGSDAGSAGRVVFRILEGGFFAWAVILLALGIGVVHGWKPVRALGALGLTLFVIIGIAALFAPWTALT
jgi:hypothetical protein